MNYITIIIARGMNEPDDEFDTEVPVAAYSSSSEASEIEAKLIAGEAVEGVEYHGLYMLHGYTTVTVPDLSSK